MEKPRTRQESLVDLGCYTFPSFVETSRSRPAQLTDWHAQLTSRFSDLPAPVVAVLALYSFGVLCAHVCGLNSVVLYLAPLLGCRKPPLRKRLTEFYKEAKAKAGFKQGIKRKDFDVTTCFAPLLRWILALWSGQHLPLAIDVTNLGSRFHVLCVSVVVRGVGIPVAWKVLRGGVKDSWNPHWGRLLRHLKPAVPAGWTVIVLSDRGLESPVLLRLIVELDWHPLMRAKKAGKFRPKGWSNFYPLHQLVNQVGVSWHTAGQAYASTRLECTLLTCWSRRARGTVVAVDRPASRSGQRRLVWLSLLDRARVQADQGRRLGLAEDTHDRSGACREAVAGAGSGDGVGGGGRKLPSRSRNNNSKSSTIWRND